MIAITVWMMKNDDVLTLHVKLLDLLPKLGTESAAKQPAINHRGAHKTSALTSWTGIWSFGFIKLGENKQIPNSTEESAFSSIHDFDICLGRDTDEKPGPKLTSSTSGEQVFSSLTALPTLAASWKMNLISAFTVTEHCCLDRVRLRYYNGIGCFGSWLTTSEIVRCTILKLYIDH